MIKVFVNVEKLMIQGKLTMAVAMNWFWISLCQIKFRLILNICRYSGIEECAACKKEVIPPIAIGSYQYYLVFEKKKKKTCLVQEGCSLNCILLYQTKAMFF